MSNNKTVTQVKWFSFFTFEYKGKTFIKRKYRDIGDLFSDSFVFDERKHLYTYKSSKPIIGSNKYISMDYEQVNKTDIVFKKVRIRMTKIVDVMDKLNKK